MKSALLVVDVMTDFEHPDGDKLLAELRARAAGSRSGRSPSRGPPARPLCTRTTTAVIWDGDRNALVEGALRRHRRRPRSGAVVPAPGDRFVIKPRYSAFDLTPLELILSSLEIEKDPSLWRDDRDVRRPDGDRGP